MAKHQQTQKMKNTIKMLPSSLFFPLLSHALPTSPKPAERRTHHKGSGQARRSSDKGLGRVGDEELGKEQAASLSSGTTGEEQPWFSETGGGFRQQRRKLRSARPASPASSTSASKKQSLVLTAVAAVSSPCHDPVGWLFCPGLELPKSP